MKITYLGQAGLLFETGDTVILVDPYLSDSVAATEPQNYRRQKIDVRFFKVKPNVVVITHAHGDHYDKETLRRFPLGADTVFLSPQSVWQDARKFFGACNCVLFDAGTEWTEKGVLFRAVKAAHSDERAIGVIITAEGKNYYVTGDTLYSERVFTSLPDLSFEAVFLPVNGRGNNMNFADADRFVKRLQAKYAVPVHIGMFDCLTAEKWNCSKKVVPQIYREIKLD